MFAGASTAKYLLCAQIIQLSGAEYLGVKPLTTDGVTFPANSRVGSSIKLDWYRLGYRYTIPISFAENGTPDLTFTPWASVIALDFAYHLSAANVAPASRHFTKPGVQIGAVFAWRPKGGPLSLEAAIGGFPTMNNLPTISVESLYARYHFYEWHRFDFTGLLGIAWEQQEYRDDKPLPNQVSANFGPMLLVRCAGQVLKSLKSWRVRFVFEHSEMRASRWDHKGLGHDDPSEPFVKRRGRDAGVAPENSLVTSGR